MLLSKTVFLFHIVFCASEFLPDHVNLVCGSYCTIPVKQNSVGINEVELVLV